SSSPSNSSLGFDAKTLLGPIMDAVATEARRANDPYSRLGDVGTAILGTVGSGTPYAQNLAALDSQRRQAIQGGANMFLQVLNLDRRARLEDLQRRRTEVAEKREGRMENWMTDRLDQIGRSLDIRQDLGERAQAERERAASTREDRLGRNSADR